MRLPRTLLLTAMTAAVAVAPAANAKVKPITYCKLIQDKSGDGHSSTYGFVTSPALDVQSGDIATGKNELVAVLRLGGTDTSNENWVKIGGYGWYIGAKAGGISYKFTMDRRGQLNGGGDHPAASVNDQAVAFTFKIVGNNLEWHVKRSLLTALNKKAGQVFTDFDAHSNFNGSTADTIDKALPKYPDKALSCVKAS